MKIYTLDHQKDELIGKKGTPDRDKFENKLKRALAKKAAKKETTPSLSSSAPFYKS